MMQLKKKLSDVARNIFGLNEAIILYDLTNTYFKGSKKGSIIAKHSKKSKDRRNDRPFGNINIWISKTKPGIKR